MEGETKGEGNEWRPSIHIFEVTTAVCLPVPQFAQIVNEFHAFLCGRLVRLHYESCPYVRYSFQRVLAIAILSVYLSVCHMGRSVKNGAS